MELTTVTEEFCESMSSKMMLRSKSSAMHNTLS